MLQVIYLYHILRRDVRKVVRKVWIWNSEKRLGKKSLKPWTPKGLPRERKGKYPGPDLE